MLILIAIIAIIILAVRFVPFRIAILHPISTVKYAIIDLILYFLYHKYDLYEGGTLNCYFAHFGGGKTLSVVQFVMELFFRYNNKKVWDREAKKWVIQKVHVISNVNIKKIPYEPLVSLSQVVCCAYRNKKIDKDMGTRTIVIVCLDEASSQMNSRNFKSNIDPDFLNTLITTRHYHMSFYYTSQKFKLVDALLRSVTQRCIWCDKIWRFMKLYYYDADELEYASNPTLVQPLIRTGFFVTNKNYESYDTIATVDSLKKAVDNNEMMSESEIIAMRGNMNPDNGNVSRPSRRLKKIRKK